MKPSRWLRLASVIAALQCVAHTTLFLTYSPKHGVEEAAVIATMQAHRFNFGGFARTYWDFYFGYGLMSAFSVLLEVILFWQLATLAHTAPARTRPTAALFIFANLIHAALCAKYFFLTPIVPDLLIAGCLAFAWIAARPGETSPGNFVLPRDAFTSSP